MTDASNNERLHILLIEDNPADADLFREVLSDVPRRLFLAECQTTFAEGRDSALSTHPDLIFLDLNLPDTGVDETIAGMADLPDDIPIVVLTGRSREEAELEALRQGAEEFLQKKLLDPGVLERRINRALERHRIDRELAEKRSQLEQYREIIDNTTDAVSIKGSDGRYLLVNPMFTETVGFSRERILGSRDADLFRRDVAEEIVRRDRQVLEGGEVMSDELVLGDEQEERAFLTTRIPLRKDGRVTGVIRISRDITERRRMREDLEQQALFDRLTELPNRVVYRDRLEQTVQRAKREAHPFAVGFLDVDDFKVVNDSFGHSSGDEVLRKIAGRLEDTLREEDTVARFGGDEFMLLLEGVEDREGLDAVGRRLREAFAAPFCVGDQEVHLAASIGFALGNPEELSNCDFDGEVERFKRAADRAMYRAKERAGTVWTIVDSALTGASSKRVQRENRIRRGIAEGEFCPFYQPICRPGTGEILGFEVLARWRHPERGLVAPAEFIELAEQTGLICELGRSIFAEAFQDFRLAASTPGGLEAARLFVNLSPRQIERSSVADRLQNFVERTCPAELAVEFEVTESDILEHTEPVARLREAGFGIWIDDFGTGYSSMSRLKDLPVDGLKIDMEFVHGALHNQADAAIVETMAELGRRLALGVVAEGIENECQLDFVAQAGCTAAQGYYLGRPRAFSQLTAVGLGHETSSA